MEKSERMGWMAGKMSKFNLYVVNPDTEPELIVMLWDNPIPYLTAIFLGGYETLSELHEVTTKWEKENGKQHE